MRILHIEDDNRIIKFVQRGLKAEGYQVDVARDGEEGLEFGRGHYSLIILDLHLPGKNGIEVCQLLRRDHIHTPILMLTCQDTVQDRVEGLHTGADDYLIKPFAFAELLARIKALLRRGPNQEIVPELRVADLSMNRETREVRRGPDQLSLTAKEYGLLEYLMTHPNKPLSRTMIIEQVWDYQFDTLSNVVDVHIRCLRQKVDHGYDRKLIQTVRDIGYKISE